MTGPESGPAILGHRALSELLDACRRDHRALLADANGDALGRIEASVRELRAAGEADVGALGVAVFSAIVRERALGPGRVLLAVVAALVFWEVNGHAVALRAGKLVFEVRRALRRRGAADAIATLLREPGG